MRFDCGPMVLPVAEKPDSHAARSSAVLARDRTVGWIHDRTRFHSDGMFVWRCPSIR
jgi:hypothetical protein